MDEGNKGYSKAGQAILETDEQKREAVIRDYDDSAAQDNVAPLDNLVRKKEELLRLKEEQDRRKKLSEDIHGGHKKSEQPPAGGTYSLKKEMHSACVKGNSRLGHCFPSLHRTMRQRLRNKERRRPSEPND